MDKHLFGLNCSLLLVCISTNGIHCLAVYTTKKTMNALNIARILPSFVLLLLAFVVLPLEVYRDTLRRKSETIDWITEKLEIGYIGIFLGMNLLTIVTKIRAYRCRGCASATVGKHFIVKSSAAIILVSSLVATVTAFCQQTGYSVLSHLCHLNTSSAILTEVIIFYHCEIVPTVAVHVIMVIFAFRYLTNSTLNNNATSPRRQFESLRMSTLVYSVVFIGSWILFMLMKLISLCEILILPAKITMFTVNPVAIGLLQRGCRMEVKEMFTTLRKRFFLQRRERDIKFSSDYRTEQMYQVKILKRLHQNIPNNDIADRESECRRRSRDFVTTDVETTRCEVRRSSSTLFTRRLNCSIPEIKIHRSDSKVSSEISFSDPFFENGSVDFSALTSSLSESFSNFSPIRRTFLSKMKHSSFPSYSCESSIDLPDFPLLGESPSESPSVNRKIHRQFSFEQSASTRIRRKAPIQSKNRSRTSLDISNQESVKKTISRQSSVDHSLLQTISRDSSYKWSFPTISRIPSFEFPSTDFLSSSGSPSPSYNTPSKTFFADTSFHENIFRSKEVTTCERLQSPSDDSTFPSCITRYSNSSSSFSDASSPSFASQSTTTLIETPPNSARSAKSFVFPPRRLSVKLMKKRFQSLTELPDQKRNDQSPLLDE